MDNIETWFQEYNLDVYNYLVYRTGSRDVEDLLQETFVKAFRNIKRFRGESSPKTWLISIARNLATDEERKRKTPTAHIDMSLIPAADDQFEKVSNELDTKRAITEAVQSLKPAFQDVVVMRGILDYSVIETAQALGWSQAKVRTTWHRALKELRMLMSAKEDKNVSI